MIYTSSQGNFGYLRLSSAIFGDLRVLGTCWLPLMGLYIVYQIPRGLAYASIIVYPYSNQGYHRLNQCAFHALTPSLKPFENPNPRSILSPTPAVHSQTLSVSLGSCPLLLFCCRGWRFSAVPLRFALCPYNGQRAAVAALKGVLIQRGSTPF